MMTELNSIRYDQQQLEGYIYDVKHDWFYLDYSIEDIMIRAIHGDHRAYRYLLLRLIAFKAMFWHDLIHFEQTFEKKAGKIGNISLSRTLSDVLKYYIMGDYVSRFVWCDDLRTMKWAFIEDNIDNDIDNDTLSIDRYSRYSRYSNDCIIEDKSRGKDIEVKIDDNSDIYRDNRKIVAVNSSEGWYSPLFCGKIAILANNLAKDLAIVRLRCFKMR